MVARRQPVHSYGVNDPYRSPVFASGHGSPYNRIDVSECFNCNDNASIWIYRRVSLAIVSIRDVLNGVRVRPEPPTTHLTTYGETYDECEHAFSTNRPPTAACRVDSLGHPKATRKERRSVSELEHQRRHRGAGCGWACHPPAVQQALDIVRSVVRGYAERIVIGTPKARLISVTIAPLIEMLFGTIGQRRSL